MSQLQTDNWDIFVTVTAWTQEKDKYGIKNLAPDEFCKLKRRRRTFLYFWLVILIYFLLIIMKDFEMYK